MAELVLFHHALGLTEGIVALADEFRGAGHTVHTPDMFAGQTFTALDDAMAHVRSVGFGELTARGVRAVAGLGVDLVYVGYSLGVLPAQRLAQTRAGARGALLIAGCVPPGEFGGPWPAAVPLQIHAQEHDPEFDNGYDLPTAQAMVAEAADGELFLYPGDKHFFADNSTPEYDASAAGQFIGHALAFFERL